MIILQPYKFYNPETERLVRAMDVPSNETRTRLINDTIDDLKDAGIWNRIDLAYFLAAHGNQPSRLNWKDPSLGVLSAQNTITFTSDTGWQGDGTTGYLDTGVNIDALTNFQQNSAHMFVWSLTNLAETSDQDIGAASGGNFIGGRSTGGNFSTRICFEASTLSVAVANSLGMYGSVRENASSRRAYKNGTLIASDTAASGSLTASPISICRSSSNASARQIAFASYGSSLTAGEVADYNTIVSTYLTAVGAI